MTCSRSVGFFFLGNKNYEVQNSAILVVSIILQNGMASAAEAKLGALFVNTKEAVVLQITLLKIGYMKSATHIQVDNSTDSDVNNSRICKNRSKAIEMQFYWVKDSVKQGHFHIY
eukprot:14560672-Ditylum_brightwellii.AAC.1